MKRRLIIFARAPFRGKVKSRLAADIGERAAAGVYARFLYATLLSLARADLEGVEIRLSVASADDAPAFADAFPEFDVTVQPSGDMGTRLAAAFAAAFRDGVNCAILIATDVPNLDARIVRMAFGALTRAPGVIGRCPDGGYYLLGLRAPGADLFHHVDWGTDRVLGQTERLAASAGIRLERLPPLMDVDTGYELTVWQRSLGDRAGLDSDDSPPGGIKA